ncbi:hypothetical protein DL93DRAFT_231881 [Clavulina sp. PMI_390]|nr:hypothetical protein DL93DRAFT_231881 [Clavulina sp. PMI_390]
MICAGHYLVICHFTRKLYQLLSRFPHSVLCLPFTHRALLQSTTHPISITPAPHTSGVLGRLSQFASAQCGHFSPSPLQPSNRHPLSSLSGITYPDSLPPQPPPPSPVYPHLPSLMRRVYRVQCLSD